MKERMFLNANNEQLIFDGNEYKKILLERIQLSKKEILISCYILESDDFGNEVLQSLIKKAQEGVKVTMIIDGFGSWGWINEEMDKLKVPNFEIRIYHSMMASALKLKWSNLNRRNHQKLFVFDQTHAMLGSRNLNKRAIEWRETNILIEGPSVVTLCALFMMMWKVLHGHIFSRYQTFLMDENLRRLKISEHIFSNYRFSLRRKLQNATLSKIKEAKSEICITTPYFFPTRKVLRAILTQAKDGVKIYVLLPKSPDVTISKWVSQRHYSRLLAAGVYIYEYEPKILHAKSMIIDEWALIGSSNFNRRSVLRDVELDYAISKTETVHSLRKQFYVDMEHSVHIKSVPPMSFLQRLVVAIMIKIFPSSL